MKIDKNILIIVGVIVVLLLFMQPGEKEFKKTATYTATRTFDDYTVYPGDTTTATYHPEVYNYIGIIEEVPTGWTPDKSISPDGKVRTTADGTDITIQWTAPSDVVTDTVQYIFNGEFFVYPDTEYTSFSQDIISVCNDQHYSQCYNGDVYWYSSCDERETIKEDCTADPCGSWGSDYCDSLTIKHDRTCYTSSCISSTCQDTPYTDTEIVTGAANSDSGVCRWQCTDGACDQNTPADTDYDGCIHDTEFPTAVFNWKNQLGGITDTVFPFVVADWKDQINCII